MASSRYPMTVEKFEQHMLDALTSPDEIIDEEKKAMIREISEKSVEYWLRLGRDEVPRVALSAQEWSTKNAVGDRVGDGEITKILTSSSLAQGYAAYASELVVNDVTLATMAVISTSWLATEAVYAADSAFVASRTADL